MQSKLLDTSTTVERLPHQLQVGDLRLAEFIQDMIAKIRVSELVLLLRLAEHSHTLTIAVHVSGLVSSNIS